MNSSKQLLKKYLCLVLCFTAALIAAAEKGEESRGNIYGKITTADDQPAAAVTVLIKNINKSAITDDDGLFELRNIQPGTYQLEVSLVGYETVQKIVIVEPNKRLEINLKIKLSLQQLQGVTVTAAKKMYVTEKPSQSLRLNANLIEVPQNIAVTTQQTIKDLGALSSSDIFRTASGLITGGAKQDVSVNIRGTETYYSILRNGVGSGYWYNMEADAGMIDRVEFIKGPAGFMISNTEPGGLVNIVTKEPTHERIGSASIGLGSWNMMRAAIDLGGEFKKDGAVTYRLNAGVQQQGDFYQFGYLKKYFVAGAIRYEPDKQTAITLEYNNVHGHQLSDGQYLPTVDGKFFVIPSKTAVVDPNVPGTVSGDQYFRFNVRHQLDDQWSLNMQAAYVSGPWGGYMMQMDGTPVSNDTLYRAMYMTDWKNSLFTMQAFMAGSFFTGVNVEHKILAGIDFGDNQTKSSGGGNWDGGHFGLYLPDPAYYIPVDTLKNFDIHQFDNQWGNKYSALYLQDHIKFFGKVIVTLAGRFTNSVTWDNYSTPSQQTDNKITPRLGLTYLFNNNISAYALYDEAFVPQSGRSFNNETFKPLTGNNREVGIKSYWFNKKLSANISVYNITKNNALTTDPLHPDFSVQTGQLVSKGIEFDLNGNLSSQLNVMANYAYTDARITKDNDQGLVGLQNFGSAHHTANLFLKYRFTNWGLKGLSFGAGAQYVGERSGVWAGYNADKGNQYLPGYTILEASAGYSFKKFFINLNLYNLANANYLTYGYKINDQDWQYTPGAPINFRLDIGVRF